ncbi:MAG TPA: M24 family metallopeptidase [Myxococcota bacterium]|nr:M24 family metallopeptidase [Myxococcota bacterium]HOD07777.1 M24 family metallopeptidase [Myxococcota bacterium]
MDIRKLQKAVGEAGFDGWLFCDFNNRDAIAYRILGLDFEKFTSRRWFYLVPSSGEPIRLVSKVEPSRLDSLPGEKRTYLSWRDLADELERMLRGKNVAMQYSPEDAIPYVSLVDAGMIDLVRAAGARIGSSADLVQVFEAVIDDAGYQTHVEAGRLIHAIKDEAFALIGDSVKNGKGLTEYDVQRFIIRRFEEQGLDCMGEFPIVGVNGHPSDPHFEPTPDNTVVIREGDTVLIDLWAKLARPGAIFYDITWVGFVGTNPPDEYLKIFTVVRDARKAAVEFVRERFARHQQCFGYEVDDACRSVVQAAGFGEFFIHRTGHSIGVNVHGNGVNIDNLETRDLRRLVPGICFSVEPGIYLPGRMAVRSEIDVFIRQDGSVEVSGPQQEELILVS